LTDRSPLSAPTAIADHDGPGHREQRGTFTNDGAGTAKNARHTPSPSATVVLAVAAVQRAKGRQNVVDHSAFADLKDNRVADRDEVAEQRDLHSEQRDHDAERRDHDADDRDAYADEDSMTLDDLFEQVRHEVVDRFARIEAATVDPALWPDLTPAALTVLQANTAEQGRLAALDRAVITMRLDRLHDEVRYLRDERLAAAHDRRASVRDRRHSAHDRQDSASDRGHWAH